MSSQRVPLRYRLSRRQEKQIERACAVSLAIPAPWWEVGPQQYVRDCLEVPPHWIRDVRELHLTVRPTTGGDGLAKQLGQILRSDSRPGGVTLEVLCYVALVSSTTTPHSTTPDQWPGNVEIFGDDGRI